MKKFIGIFIILNTCFGMLGNPGTTPAPDEPTPAFCGSPSCWGTG